MPSLNASLYYRRNLGLNFQGRTDKYLRSHQGRVPSNMPLDEAIDGKFPLDVTGVAVNDEMRDSVLERLDRYRIGKDFYEGDHFANPWQDGERKTVFNFCKTIVDKATDWHAGKGWKVIATPGNDWVSDYLNGVWRYNDRMGLTLQQGQLGATKGDSWIYVTARQHDSFGDRLKRKEWKVRLQVIDPRFVFPVWSDTNQDEMKACMIQYPVAPGDGTKLELLTIWITAKRIKTYRDYNLIDNIENILGTVNVVHIPNFIKGDSNFGTSDIEEIIPINEEYNSIAHATRQIIRYHAAPTTIIYGARASQLEKGANAVWSGLPSPKEARVENLQLESDLAANFSYLAQMREMISQLSYTPKIAFDISDQLASNVSTSTLELMFQPLLEKTRRRQISHRKAVNRVNRLIIMVEERIIGTDITALADNVEELYDTDCEYVTPLPRDEAAELDIGIKKVVARVWSVAELIRRCSGVENRDRLILELMADKRAELIEGFEKQRALNGERPNSLSAFIGSEVLDTDAEKIMEEIAVLEQLAGAQTDKLVKKETPKPLPVAPKSNAPKAPIKVRVVKDKPGKKLVKKTSTTKKKPARK